MAQRQGSTGSGESNSAGEKSSQNHHPDLLHRMSKKIAQLTKVVHALFTKLDDYEIVMRFMRESHEDELRRLRTEARNALAHYKAAKMGRDSDLRQQIEDLEQRLAESERRTQELILEAQEAKLKNSQSLSAHEGCEALRRAEAEASLAHLTQIQKEHETRVSELETVWKANQQANESRITEAENRLECALEDNETLRQKIIEEYEPDLAACRLLTQDLRKTGEQLRVQLINHESEFQKNIINLTLKSQLRKEENEALELKIISLYENIDNKDKNISSFNEQVTENTQTILKLTEELNSIKKENESLKDDIVIKEESSKTSAERMAELEETKTKLEAIIDTLGAEQEEIQKKALETETSKEKETKDKMEEIQKALDNVMSEKKSIQERYEKDFEYLRNCNAEREHKLMEDCEWKLREIQKDSKTKVENEKKKSDEWQKKLQQDHEFRCGLLTSEKDKLRTELKALNADTKEKLESAEAELRQLRGLTNELQKGIKVATTHVDQMRNVEIRLREEHSLTRHQLREQKQLVTKLQNEITEDKKAHERELHIRELRYNTRLKDETYKLQNIWSEKLRIDNENFRMQCESQYREEKISALAELRQQMDEDFLKMQNDHKDVERDFNLRINTLTNELEETNTKLKEEKRLLNESTTEKISNLKRILEEKNNEILKMEAEEKLKEQQVDDLQMQLTAYRKTMELVREEAERQKCLEIERVKEENERKLEEVRKEYETKSEDSIDELSSVHKAHLQSARNELEKVIELAMVKEKEQQKCISELRNEINRRDDIIECLNNEIDRLQNNLSKMTHELEFHGKELLRVRSEASQQIGDLKDKRRDPRPEDLTAIKQLRVALINKDCVAKKLQEEKKMLQLQLFQQISSYSSLSGSTQTVASIDHVVVKRTRTSRHAAAKRLSAPILPSTQLNNQQHQQQHPSKKSGKKSIGAEAPS